MEGFTFYIFKECWLRVVVLHFPNQNLLTEVPIYLMSIQINKGMEITQATILGYDLRCENGILRQVVERTMGTIISNISN